MITHKPKVLYRKSGWVRNCVYNDMKKADEINERVIHCPACNCRIVFSVYQPSKICARCGRKVINNSKWYFKYRLRKELNKGV